MVSHEATDVSVTSSLGAAASYGNGPTPSADSGDSCGTAEAVTCAAKSVGASTGTVRSEGISHTTDAPSSISRTSADSVPTVLSEEMATSGESCDATAVTSSATASAIGSPSIASSGAFKFVSASTPKVSAEISSSIAEDASPIVSGASGPLPISAGAETCGTGVAGVMDCT